MRVFRYAVAVLLLVVDILLFADLAREVAVPESSWLVNLLMPGVSPSNLGWFMAGLAVFFILMLAAMARWAFMDVAGWIRQQVE